jgi:5-methylcytosine-specific restriction endonuclease McrA
VRVLVVDTNRQPLDPCHPARARKLLGKGRAAVYRRYPFTILLKDRTVEKSVVHPYRIKIDPGSKIMGFAVLNEETGQVIWAAELTHRGQQIRDALLTRRMLRRRRRSRKTRYRAPRFLNRRRPEGWLPPSLLSRVVHTITWVKRLMRFCPVTAISQELSKFDTQALENPEISGVEYQQGTLHGYEVREYLLQKWGRRCAYCRGEKVPLAVEHITPRSKGGSNRISNLTLACHACNESKGSQLIEEFLARKPDLLEQITSQAKVPLKDAAAINATRWELFQQLQNCDLPVEYSTGGRTKFNRVQRHLPKTHWLDAACIGTSTPEQLYLRGVHPLLMRATGHGVRQRCRTDKFGFPHRHAPRAKKFFGFQTGDIVVADIPTGKLAGRYIGRVVIRFRPSFRLNGINVHPKYLRVIHHADGYDYTQRAVTS